MILKGYKNGFVVYEDKHLVNFYNIVKSNVVNTLADCDYITLDNVYIQIGEKIDEY